MGMDLNGRNPTGKCGEYFRNDIWSWPHLASYCNMIAPDICTPCRCWYTNDGDGLDAAGAVALADTLEAEINAGRTAVYAAFEYPQRPDPIFAEEPRDPPLCRAFVENVAVFAAFLRESGGFSIW